MLKRDPLQKKKKKKKTPQGGLWGAGLGQCGFQVDGEQTDLVADGLPR
jgi:hypothetical protein